MEDIELIVQGEKIHLNRFTSNVLHDVLMAFLKNLRNVEIEKISKVEIS